MLTTRKVMALALTTIMVLGSLVMVSGEARADDAGWVEDASMPLAAADFAYCKLNDGRVFANGGAPETGSLTYNGTFIYDPEQGTWAEMKDSLWSLYGAAAVAMPDDKVYVFGGYDRQRSSHNVNAMIYDIGEDQWTFGTHAMPNGAWNLQAVALDDTTVLLAGGYNVDSSVITDACYIYDTVTDTFTVTDNMPAPLASGAMFMFGGLVYYFGGWTTGNVPMSSLYYYNPAHENWYYYTDLPEDILGHRAVAGTDGVIYMVGGGTNVVWSGTNTDRTTILSLRDYSFTDVAPLDIKPRYAGLVELDSGELFAFGGLTYPTVSNQTFRLPIWSKEAWTDKSAVGTGEGLRVYLDIDVYQHGPAYISGQVDIVKDGVTYLNEYLHSDYGLTASVLLTVPGDLEPGTYQIMLTNVYVSTGLGDGYFEMEPISLTVEAAPSIQDRLDDLEAQNDALQDQIDALQENLDAANADLKEATDAKLDAMIGYAILILVLVTLLVGIIVLVRKR